MLPFEEIKAAAPPPPPPVAAPAATETAKAAPAPASKKGVPPPAPANTRTAFQRTDVNAAPAAGGGTSDNNNNGLAPGEMNQAPSEGLLINGSVNNGAASPFAQSAAFGNNRRGARSFYNGSLGLNLRNSTLDARTYSLTGQDTPKPGYSHMTGLASFGGPLRIPYLLRRGGPNVTATYQWMRNRNANNQSVLMPTLAERSGDFSNTLDPLGQRVSIFDPSNGQPFAGNVIPRNRLSHRRSRCSVCIRAEFRFGFALQLPDPAGRLDASGQSASPQPINRSAARTASPAPSPCRARVRTAPTFSASSIPPALRESTRTSTGCIVSRAGLPEFGRPVQPVLEHRDAVLRRSREYIGAGRDHREQPGAGELGTARSEFCGRHRRPFRCAAGIQPQPDHRCDCFALLGARTAQPDHRRRIAPAAIQSAFAAGSARHVYLYGRCGGQRFRRLPAGRSRHQLDRIRQRRQVSARRITTTAFSRMTGASARRSRSTGARDGNTIRRSRSGTAAW